MSPLVNTPLRFACHCCWRLCPRRDIEEKVPLEKWSDAVRSRLAPATFTFYETEALPSIIHSRKQIGGRRSPQPTHPEKQICIHTAMAKTKRKSWVCVQFRRPSQLSRRVHAPYQQGRCWLGTAAHRWSTDLRTKSSGSSFGFPPFECMLGMGLKVVPKLDSKNFSIALIRQSSKPQTKLVRKKLVVSRKLRLHHRRRHLLPPMGGRWLIGDTSRSLPGSDIIERTKPEGAP